MPGLVVDGLATVPQDTNRFPPAVGGADLAADSADSFEETSEDIHPLHSAVLSPQLTILE
jgi:hypothetical protein